jgi:SPP1 family predicted phage head-tail adaptor
MNIGKLRNKIELQSFTSTANAIGEQLKTWTTYSTVWAHIRPMSGRELINAQQPVGEITHQVTIRYNSSVSVDDRIRYYDSVKSTYRYFDINYVGDRDERNAVIVLMCKEAV